MEWFPRRYAGAPSEDEFTRTVDPRREEDERHRWTMEALRWRAHHIAQVVFDGECASGIGPFGAGGPFVGAIELEVPFAGTDDHLARESVFRSMVAHDPVLGGFPLLFLFSPRSVRRVSVEVSGAS